MDKSRKKKPFEQIRDAQNDSFLGSNNKDIQDMHGRRIVNAADARHNQDLVTKKQLDFIEEWLGIDVLREHDLL